MLPVKLKTRQHLNAINFRGAIRDLGEDEFRTYDKRIQEDVAFLMKNLQERCH